MISLREGGGRRGEGSATEFLERMNLLEIELNWTIINFAVGVGEVGIQ